MNTFYREIHSHLGSGGYVDRRFGGSSGKCVPNKDFFNYIKCHNAVLPRVLRASKLFKTKNQTRWEFIYISPYNQERKAVAGSYSQPVRGGQLQVNAALFASWPTYFHRMTMARTMTSLLLEELSTTTNRLLAVPEACDNQDEHMAYATMRKATPGVVLYRLVRYVSYTVVEHAMSKHNDVSKTSWAPFVKRCKLTIGDETVKTPRPFIEVKALHLCPELGNGLATSELGRGGAGIGNYVWGIVDHPYAPVYEMPGYEVDQQLGLFAAIHDLWRRYGGRGDQAEINPFYNGLVQENGGVVDNRGV